MDAFRFKNGSSSRDGASSYQAARHRYFGCSKCNNNILLQFYRSRGIGRDVRLCAPLTEKEQQQKMNRALLVTVTGSYTRGTQVPTLNYSALFIPKHAPNPYPTPDPDPAVPIIPVLPNNCQSVSLDVGD